MLLNTFFAQPGTDLDSTWTPPGLLTVQALIWNLPGIYLESMDFTWNPPGVHGNGGGSVKHCYSTIQSKSSRNKIRGGMRMRVIRMMRSFSQISCKQYRSLVFGDCIRGFD
jgi:hypothetical protein